MRRILKYMMLLALLLPASQTTLAQDATATHSDMVNVVHSKEWYEQSKFDYTWRNSQGATVTSKLTDKATDPDQIIALLTKVYTDKDIPGIYFAGYGDINGQNLTTRTRPVYYGGIDGGWEISGNGDIYTDYGTYKPNVEGYTVLLVAVKSTWQKDWNVDENGKRTTIKDPLYFQNQDRDALRNYIANSIQYVQLLTDGMRLNEGSTNADYPAGTLFVLGDGAGLDRLCFLSKGQARDTYHGDRADAQILAPFGRMFEQFSPTNGQTDDESSNVTDFFQKLQQGEEFPIQHDCNSVIDVEHYFSMSGKRTSDPKNVTGLQFFIPDRRLAYWVNEETNYWMYHARESILDNSYFYFGKAARDGRVMNYDEGIFLITSTRSYSNYGSDYLSVGDLCMIRQGQCYGPIRGTTSQATADYNFGSFIADGFSDNAHGGGYAEYGQYNQEYSPKTSWYRIDLTATPVHVEEGKFGEHTYKIDLSWETTMKKLTPDELEQEFWIYEVKPNGTKVLIGGKVDENGNPIYGQGVKQTTWTVADNADALTVEQYQAGRKLTYIVIGKPIEATYPPVQCYEPADAIIPGYDKHERLSLQIGTDYYSKYYPNGDQDDHNGEYNQYCNSVKIENGIGNSVYQNYLDENTTIDAYRIYTENGVTNSVKFASMKFGAWETTPVTIDGAQRYRIPYTVTYDGQKGDVPQVMGKQVESGYLYTVNTADAPENNAVYFGKDGVELLDCFRGYTANNDHPDQYTYNVTFKAAAEFEIDNQGNKSNEVNSNDEIIPVFKSQYSLNNQGYVLEQVVKDKDHDMSNMLPAHITFDKDGIAQTDLNKVNVTLDANAKNQIYRYEIYREPKTMNLSDDSKIAYAQSTGNGQYEVVQRADKDNDPMESVGTITPSDYSFVDHVALRAAGSYGYVPVISVKSNNDKRNDYNTYGADIQRVGVPSLQVAAVDGYPMRSTYDWPKNNPTYTYYEMQFDAEATLPDAFKYDLIGWRSWRKLSDPSMIQEDFVNLTRNTPDGFMFDEHMQQDTKPNPYVVGETEVNWGELTRRDGETVSNVKANTGVFGAKIVKEGSLDVDYIIRLYYHVNDTKNKAPRRAGGMEQTSEQGQFYIADYKINTRLTSEVITGVSGISADRQVAAVVYYNPMGVASSTPWRGVNVVVTRYTDGSTVTAKVLR